MNRVPDSFPDTPNGQPMLLSHAGATVEQERSLLPPLLLQYWHSVVRRRWIIAGIVTACLVIGLVVTLLTSPLYTGRTQLEISREQKQITNVQGLESEQAGRDTEFYATQYALLKTRPVAERVMRDMRLDKNNEFFAAHGIDVTAFDGTNGGAATQKVREKLAIDTLLANIEISPVRTSRLVDIRYSSRSPDISARIANAWAKAFISASMDRQFASTADARRFLEQRLGTLRERLEQSERQVVTYASERGIVALDTVRDADGRTQSNRTLTSSNLDALNTALNKAIEQRIMAESRRREVGDAAPEALGNPALAGLRQQRAQAAAEHARLSVQYESGYPAIQALTRQIRALDTAIAQETRRVSSNRSQEYQQALARESELRERVEQLRSALNEQQRASIQYNIYMREADTNRQLYDALLQRYKEIGVAGTVGANNITIVEPAQVPTVPSSPNLLLNILLSLMAGIALSGAAVLALEQIDEGIREPAQVQPQLKLPLLGNTPRVTDELMTELRDAKSHLYEAYFSIRSNLSFATDHGFPRSMAVTSTRPAEGKSSTALALSIILGRTGKRVLLVDADMRSPSVHALTGNHNESGLSNYLAGNDDWRRMAQATDLTGVSIVAAGPTPPSAAELLSGERLERFVADVLEQYDHIVVDAPPILGISDAPIISRAIEGCVLVVQAGAVPVRGIRASIARLQMAHAHIFGVVLTKLQPQAGGYGYGYGYGYAYGYGSDNTSADQRNA